MDVVLLPADRSVVAHQPPIGPQTDSSNRDENGSSGDKCRTRHRTLTAVTLMVTCPQSCGRSPQARYESSGLCTGSSKDRQGTLLY